MKIKNNFNKFKKNSFLTILTLSLILNLNTTYAIGIPTIDIANLGENIVKVIQGVNQAYQTVKVVYQGTKAATAAVQNVKNLNMSQLASSLSGDAMSQVGDIVTKNLGTQKDASTNVLTGGSQVITDLNGYINKSSTNSVKKSLNDLSAASTNPFNGTAVSDIVKKFRNSTQDKIDQLKIVGLAAVAQKEICNNTKLKDIIKNGEPSTWVNPKPALKNVDIDELCSASLTAKAPSTDQSDQFNITAWNTPINRYSSSVDVKNLKAFLFDKGYFATVPSSSIFDSATTDAVKAFQKDQGLDVTGEVDDMTQTAMIAAEGKAKAITGKAAQSAWISIANAGYGGPLTKAALSDPSNSPSGIQSSMQALINKDSADSQFAATNKYNANGGIIGNEKCLDKDGNIKKFDPTDPTTAYCDNTVTDASSSAAKIKADLDAARQSPYLGILAKANSTNDCGGKDKTLTSICKASNKVSGYLGIVNSILGIANTVSTGGTGSLKDSQFSQLASSLDGLQKLDQSKTDLSKAATADTNNYNTAQSQADTQQNNDLADKTAANQAQSSIRSVLDKVNSISTTTPPITYTDITGQSNNSNTSPYSGQYFDYDNGDGDSHVLLNQIMSIVKVSNLSSDNTQIMNVQLNDNANSDWGIVPNLIGGTFKIINKKTGKATTSGTISGSYGPGEFGQYVNSEGTRFKVFDANVLDIYKDDIENNGGITNTIIDIEFNVYFKTLNKQKNPSDFSVGIRFYIDGSKY
jgi:hypothetical protein